MQFALLQLLKGPLFLIIVVFAICLPSLQVELNLDELGTYWVIKDGFKEAIHRSYQVQGQSPLYYVLIAFSTSVFGISEITLRLPSVFFILVASYYIYLTGALLLSPRTGYISSIFFLTSLQVVEAASIARPYALAILGLCATTYYFLLWLQNSSSRALIYWTLSACVMVYAHYIFVVYLPILLILFAAHSYSKDHIHRRRASIHLSGALYMDPPGQVKEELF